MLESITSSSHNTEVVKDDIEGELFSANTIRLTAFAINLKIYEQLHRSVET